MTEEESIKKAEEFKAEGNEWFKLGKFESAVKSYTASLENHRTPVVLCNRAFAYIKQELAGAAIADAEEAIALDDKFAKAYYRRASAHMLLNKWKDAKADFELVLKLEPGNGDTLKRLELCRAELRRIAFANAIATEETTPIYEKLKFENIAVPSNYTGPKLGDDGVITEDYVLKMMEHFREEKTICTRDIVHILKTARELMVKYPNIVSVPLADDEEITVCGDTHGQYYDLLNIFKINGNPGVNNRYLFNGDFVDRGSYSAEVITTMLAWKCVYPEHFLLSRGNHESENMTKVYGFQGEVKAKYNADVVLLFKEVFKAIPIGHVLNGKVFVVHGGLYSKEGVTIADLQKEKRGYENLEEGLLCECMWSDPQPMPGRGISKRGVGCSFGPDVTERFLRNNNLELVVRSHEVKDEGYEVHHDGKCITVFSAPNYCDQIGNKGAFIRFKGSDMKPKFTSFAHVKHPGKRPMQYSNALMGMF